MLEYKLKKKNILCMLLVAVFIGCGSPSGFTPNETVSPTGNFAPIATAQSVILNGNSTKTIILSGVDPDGDALNYVVITQPINGIFENGIYTPAVNYYGSDSFTFVANDGSLTSAYAIVSITIIDDGKTTIDKLKEATVRIETSKSGSRSSGGTGFLIDNIGHIVTNNHVAAGVSEFRVYIEGKERAINAEAMTYSECSDLAVIRLTEDINNKPLTWYKKDLKEGMDIVVAGFPSDTKNSDGERQYAYSAGAIGVKLSQNPMVFSSVESFLYDAVSFGGSSGSPVIELKTGKIVGVHHSISAINHSNRKIAISGKVAQYEVSRMINGENIYSLGIFAKVMFNKDNNPAGVRVWEVNSGMPADKVGIKVNDVIVRLADSALWYDIKNMSYNDSLRVRTLEKYCSILKSNNPNDLTNTMLVLILRARNEKAYFCEGTINGEPLMLFGDSSKPCPE